MYQKQEASYSIAASRGMGEGKSVDLERKRNIVVYGLETQLNIEVESWRKIVTRATGKTLVFIRFKEEKIAQAILQNSWRFKGTDIYLSPDRPYEERKRYNESRAAAGLRGPVAPVRYPVRQESSNRNGYERYQRYNNNQERERNNQDRRQSVVRREQSGNGEWVRYGSVE